MSVTRIFVEKKPGFDVEAKHIQTDLTENLGVKGIEELRLLHRYDVEGLSQEEQEDANRMIFSEPNVDHLYGEDLQFSDDYHVFAMEYLPGQYDQRADSAAQCVQLLTHGERPKVATARVIAIKGSVSEADMDKIKNYLINPVESRLASLEKPASLDMEVEVPEDVEQVKGMISWDDATLEKYYHGMGFAMTMADLKFCRDYFRDEEKRDPYVTELRVIDTYWSDHCRHTTFFTSLESIEIQKGQISHAIEQALKAYYDTRNIVYGETDRPVSLMDMAVIGAKLMRKQGKLDDLDVSEEINACSIEVPVEIDGKTEQWLVQFKNETHNHPTEIEPFGGAATCLGGAIRDPLSGRVYVHQAMRVTGGGDPRKALAETLSGKLPQRKLAQTAAAGYSSYGNQIGLATGHVAELYHEGYVAKHLECGAVVGAAPASNVRRERPAPGDVVILLGGRTGRDGIGGATGSSKSHNKASLDTMASEVQKGNAPEERKLQRLFRDPAVTRLIKRCNDFGAGGVSVAIGELADGLSIDLDAVRKKYDGLDGTELAISESQERMAVVVAPADVDALLAAAARENLESYPVASVTAEPRMVMTWRGQTVASLSRAFLNTNGAAKHARVSVPQSDAAPERAACSTLREMAASLKCASRRGLTERFDGSIGAGSVLMPFGGKYQRTPTQAMAALLPVLPSEEDFPYAIRVVSEVLSSNGSTSQASVCGSCLALMDAGVPIKAPVAGIAMGLIERVEEDGSSKMAILSDIQGMEDFLGDMDFKVAGTAKGVTAIQMDIKVHGLSKEVLQNALKQAYEGRMHIMKEMLDELPAPREEMSPYAPRIISMHIDPDHIRTVIGPGGKTINRIIAETGVKIDIDDTGLVYIAAPDMKSAEAGVREIELLTKEPEPGEIYEGKVTRIMNFGAFIEILPGKEGLLHISKMAKGRVEKVEDVMNIGDTVRVKVTEIDSQNRINLSRKELL